MRRLIGAELRRLTRWWPVWPLPVLVAVVGVAMLPVNADLYLHYVYYDPQGAAEELEAYHVDLAAAATSGLGWAQVPALLVGAALVLHGGPGARHPSRIVPKAAAAGLFGLLLAAADVAPVLPGVAGALAGTVGAPPDIDLGDRLVWTVVACGVLQVALFGVLGVGLAAWIGRWWPLLAVVGVVTAGTAMFLAQDLGTYLVLGLLGALPVVLLWYITVTGSAPVAVVMSLAAAGVALLAGLARAGTA